MAIDNIQTQYPSECLNPLFPALNGTVKSLPLPPPRVDLHCEVVLADACVLGVWEVNALCSKLGSWGYIEGPWLGP